MENRTLDDWIDLAHKLNRYTKPLGLLYKLEMLDMDILVKILLEKFSYSLLNITIRSAASLFTYFPT